MVLLFALLLVVLRLLYYLLLCNVIITMTISMGIRMCSKQQTRELVVMGLYLGQLLVLDHLHLYKYVQHTSLLILVYLLFVIGISIRIDSGTAWCL